MKVNIKHPISLLTCLFLCYVLFRVEFMVSPWKDGRSISFDPAGYYLSLPATFIYGDLEHFAFYDSTAAKYIIGDAVSHTVDLPDGKKTLKYSLGMAVLYSPGFFVANAVAEGWAYPADGYSKPYVLILSIWALIVASIGLLTLRRLLLRYYDDLTAAITLFLLVLATNYLIYAGINNLMSHSFLFTLYALLLFFTDRWHLRPGCRDSVVIGLILGLMAITRPTEIIAALFPILWGVSSWRGLSERITKLWKHRFKLLTTALCVLLVGSIQLLYWKIYTGSWLFYSYQDQGFDWLNPHIWDGLFSFRNGWLIYTPLKVFALVGFWPLYVHRKGLFLPIFLYFLLNLYIVFSWSIWWYGGSVGARAVIQSYAALCFPLAAFIQLVKGRLSSYWQLGFGILALLFVDLNLMMTWQSHTKGGPWYAEYMTRPYFFKIVGKTVTEKSDKKFLDVSTELRSEGSMAFKTLYFNDFEQEEDSIFAGRSTEISFSGRYAVAVGSEQHNIVGTISLYEERPHHKAWLRLGAMVLYKNMEWNEWRMARLKMQFLRDGKVIDVQQIRLQWLADAWTWTHLYFEYPLRKAFDQVKPGDAVQLIVEHGGSEQAIYLDDLKLELIQPK